MLSTFHPRVKYISHKNTPLKPMGQWPTPETALSREACGPPFRTSVSGPTPLTMPNDSSIGSRTSAQLRNKGPIGYNGTPQIHNCPFPFDNHHSNLIHPFLNRPHSPSQTASGSNQPFCHSTLSGPTDRLTDTHTQTDRWARRQVSRISACACYIDRERRDKTCSHARV